MLPSSELEMVWHLGQPTGAWGLGAGGMGVWIWNSCVRPHDTSLPPCTLPGTQQRGTVLGNQAISNTSRGSGLPESSQEQRGGVGVRTLSPTDFRGLDLLRWDFRGPAGTDASRGLQLHTASGASSGLRIEVGPGRTFPL